MNKNIKAFILGLIMFMISLGSVNAVTIKENIDDIKDRTVVIGITKFTPDQVITILKAGIAAENSYKFNVNNPDYEGVSMYYYLLGDWYKYDADNNLDENIPEDELKSLNNPEFYYVDNIEKVLEVPFDYNLSTNEKLAFAAGNNSDKILKENANYKNGDPLRVPATVTQFKVQVQNTETNTTADIISYEYEAGKTEIDTIYKMPEEQNNKITLANNTILKTPYVIAEGEELTIDLNGYILSAAEGSIFFDNKGTLVIEENNGKILVSSEDQLLNLYKLGLDVNMTLSSDITINEALNLSDQVIKTLDLNQKTLTLKGGQAIITGGAELTIINGKINILDMENGKAAFVPEKDSKVTLNKTNVTSSGVILYPRQSAAEANVIDSTLTTSGYYAISTNSNTQDNYGVAITIKNSTISAVDQTKKDSTAVMINVAGTLNITDSVLTGERQALIVRAGNATLSNTDLIVTGKFTNNSFDVNYDKVIGNWGTGNEVPSAALVVGNHLTKAYYADANVTIGENVTLNVESNIWDVYELFIASGHNGQATVISGTDESWNVGMLLGDGGKITHNANVFNGVSTADELTAAYNSTDEGIITLTKDIEYNEKLNLSGDIKKHINLNEYTLTYAGGQAIIKEGAELSITNGSMVITNLAADVGAFVVESKSSVTLEDMSVLGSSGVVLYPRGDAAKVDVINTYISTSGYYAISTNAKDESHYGVIINIDNSSIYADSNSESDSAAVMMNVEGTLNINESYISGLRQGVIVRAGTANITGSEENVTTIATSDAYLTRGQNANEAILNGAWGTGNEVPSAALVVGNYAQNAYLADAIVTMDENVILSVLIRSMTPDSPMPENLYIASGHNNQTTVVNGVSVSMYPVIKTQVGYYVTVDGQVITTATTEAELEAGLLNAKVEKVMMLNDITYSKNLGMSGNVKKIINLNSNTLNYTGGQAIVTAGADLTLRAGYLTVPGMADDKGIFVPEANSKVTLDNIIADTTGVILFPRQSAAEANVIDSQLTTSGNYVIATNSNTEDNYGVAINVTDSILYAQNQTVGDSTGILLNVAGTLDITNSYVFGERQGVIVRAGTANITNTAIETSAAYLTYEGNLNEMRLNGTWGTGNEVPSAALVVGNYTNDAYHADAIVTVDANSNLNTLGSSVPNLYIASGHNNQATIFNGYRPYEWGATPTQIKDAATGNITVN